MLLKIFAPVVALVEGDGVQQQVDGRHHVLAVLPGGAVHDGQAAADEVVLHVHDHLDQSQVRRLWAVDQSQLTSADLGLTIFLIHFS